jgi:hypothetical protein
MKGRNPAVASTVTAFHIAPESTFPEKLPERMLFLTVENQLTLKFQCNPLFNR